jgi:hypothetical protein
MKVTDSYQDNESYTIQEAKQKVKSIFGEEAVVDVRPDSSEINSYLYYALQAIITPEQISEFFDGDNNLDRVRSSTLDIVSKMVERVIIDNEEKLIKE